MLRFDHRDYLLRNPDLRTTVAPASARFHYEHAGRQEGRRARFVWLWSGASARLLKFTRPTSSHWSGVQLWCWRRETGDGLLHVDLHELEGLSAHLVRSAHIPTASIDDASRVPIYWRPLSESCGGRYLLTVTQRDARGRALRPAPFILGCDSGDDGLIYSPPISTSAFPEALLFSPVTQCNLGCIHCVSAFSRRQADEFTDRWWDELRTAVASSRLRSLRCDYSGDLFFSQTRPARWLDRVIGLDVPFAIDTHANNLDATVVARLMASRLYSINFSLDTMDPDDYPRLRRGARPLPEVVDDIRCFMTARNRERRDIETVLSFTLMRRTLDTLSDAIDLAAELGVTAVCGNHLQVWNATVTGESLMLDPGRYRDAFDALHERARAAGVRLGLPPPVTGAVPRRSHRPCKYPWTTAAVLGNGDVMACCVPGTRVGNLHDAPLADIWNGAEMRAFRESVNSDRPPAPCRDCPVTRLETNLASYVPGLGEREKRAFSVRCDANTSGARARRQAEVHAG